MAVRGEDILARVVADRSLWHCRGDSGDACPLRDFLAAEGAVLLLPGECCFWQPGTQWLWRQLSGAAGRVDAVRVSPGPSDRIFLYRIVCSLRCPQSGIICALAHSRMCYHPSNVLVVFAMGFWRRFIHPAIRALHKLSHCGPVPRFRRARCGLAVQG